MQIEAYRAAFDEVWGKGENPKSFGVQHVPGLFPIIRDGFALVSHYMTETPKKELYLPYVQRLWEITQKVNKKERLSSAIFQEMSEILALIVEGYNVPKGQREPFGSLREEDTEIFGSQEKRKKSVEERLKTLENALEKDTSSEQFVDEVMGGDTSERLMRAVFILYANPNPNVKKRDISPGSFVNQYCQGNYPGYIALFDVLSKPKEEKPWKGWGRPLNITVEERKKYWTREDPHYSLENGTEKMLEHDYQHINGTVAAEESLKKLGFQFRDCLGKIYQIKVELDKDPSKTNESKILSDGIFMLFHEMAPRIADDLDDETEGEIKRALGKMDEFGAFKVLVEWGKEDMIDTLNDYISGGLTYKRELRDWEFILGNKDLNGNPLWVVSPVVNMSIGMGQKRRREEEEPQEHVKKKKLEEEAFFLEFEHEFSFPLPKEPELIFEKQKFTNFKEKHEAIKRGYVNFWDSFLEIIKKYQKKISEFYARKPNYYAGGDRLGKSFCLQIPNR